MNRVFLLAFWVLTVPSGCKNPDQYANAKADRVQMVLDSLVSENQVPGVSYAMVFQNQTLKSYASGYADVHQRTQDGYQRKD